MTSPNQIVPRILGFDSLGDRIDLAESAIEYVRDNFPALDSAWKKSAVPFTLGYSAIDGACSHPDLADYEWLGSYGPQPFFDAELPEGFFMVGVQNRGSSEYLLVMLAENGRRLWFYDCYVRFTRDSTCSTEATERRLEDVLGRWNRGEVRVFYSERTAPGGPFGDPRQME